LSKQHKEIQTNLGEVATKLQEKNLNALLALSVRIAEHPNEKLIEKFTEFCLEYERVLIQNKVDATDQDAKLKSMDLLEPLTLEDICALLGSKDINARSMGAMIFVDYALSRSDALFIEELVTCGAIENLLLSIQHQPTNEKDRHLIDELKFFATKSIADLCWAPNHFKLRQHIVDNKQVPIATVIDRLIEQIGTNDPDLVGVSVTTLALLGRGGISGVDHLICIERNGLKAFTILAQKIASNPRDKNAIYVSQALAWLSSSDTDIKLEMIRNKSLLAALVQLCYQRDITIKCLAMITLGNICQNPEIWGRPALYSEMSVIVDDLVHNHNVVDLLAETVVDDNLELQYNSIVTLTQLLGFQHARTRFDILGGEMLLFDIMVNPQYSAIKDQASKSIRFYRTLQDYGDRMGDILLPKFRLNHSQQQQRLVSPSPQPPQPTIIDDIEDQKKKTNESFDDLMASLEQESPKKKKKEKKKKKKRVTERDVSPIVTPSVTPSYPEKKDSTPDMYRLFINEFSKGMTELATQLCWGD
jgi:hypothetical protein